MSVEHVGRYIVIRTLRIAGMTNVSTRFSLDSCTRSFFFSYISRLLSYTYVCIPDSGLKKKKVSPRRLVIFSRQISLDDVNNIFSLRNPATATRSHWHHAVNHIVSFVTTILHALSCHNDTRANYIRIIIYPAFSNARLRIYIGIGKKKFTFTVIFNY